MPAHLIAFSSVVPTDTLQELTALKDDVLTRTSDNRYLVPGEINNVHYAAALSTALSDAYLFAPSFEVKRTRPRIIPSEVSQLKFDLGNPKVCEFKPPLALVPTEELSFYGKASANVRVVGLALLGSTALEAPPSGEVRVVRCTSNTTLTPFEWTTCKLTPDISLEAGTYALVGFKAISDNAIAARVIVRGQLYRPGVPALAGREPAVWAHGKRYDELCKLMNFGTFGHLDIPEIQFLSSAADDTEVVYLYLVKTG